ncbi:hypothetical protein GII40_00138 [Candidatus Profftia lariciata]|uniref:Trm112 family protein n=1 Tax=Candidatus Profftia lariciata TaxID=1987921 RepID=UPI001D021392|nr:Trm112 family protein [Candidatus Profftia lariciata]UDG81360.1 hypothetical protein GII40_00138 [Candidatus Profftia lariciata]
MDDRLLKIIVCPVCNRKLYFNKMNQELICKNDRLSYPIYHGIPVLLKNKARLIPINENN